MGKRAKLEKFAEIGRMPNVFQNIDYKNAELIDHSGNIFSSKGNWNQKYFLNDAPIIAELGCGSGVYTTSLAELYPNRNFIGIDIKGHRIYTGARYARENQLDNVAFIRTRIEFLDHFFAENELDEIWITFPDPFQKRGKAARRMTSPFFLKLYEKMLKIKGILHLKTDSLEMYEYSRKVLAESTFGNITMDISDLYQQSVLTKELMIKTKYELQHLKEGRIIKYLKFQFL